MIDTGSSDKNIDDQQINVAELESLILCNVDMGWIVCIQSLFLLSIGVDAFSFTPGRHPIDRVVRRIV